MAVRFGKLFGNGSGFWFNLQHNNDLARAERSVDISRIPTLETMHSWTTAVRNCTSLRNYSQNCNDVTMLQMSFVDSRLRRNRTTTGGCPYDDGALTGMKCTDLTTRPPSISVY